MDVISKDSQSIVNFLNLMKKWKLIRDNKNTIGGEENGENDKTGNKKIIENFLIGAGHPASDEI